ACGDALGVPYEFGPPLHETKPEMVGGGLGPYAPGEWSDDTQMAICTARVTAEGPLDDRALGRIMRGFQHCLDDGASDVGNQTRAVLA
ncbi:ADP-ribosylglycohydrolase family protein, partial [Bradyrhizobium cosmicum]